METSNRKTTSVNALNPRIAEVENDVSGTEADV